jgi:peptidoglycan/xylan/chitin deacetylase (PgdA/CDA1 family)
MTPALTVVLALRAGAGKGETDLDRFQRLLWPSFAQNWRLPGQLHWLIVCPPADVNAIEQRLRALDVEGVQVVDEDRLLPSLVGKSGWFKQQLVKLAAADLVTTPHYLTLDADVLLLRRIAIDDLLPGGRPRLGARRGADHMDWWQASARMLKSSIHVAPGDAVMGVTPALLETATARQVLPEVARRNGVADAAAFLFDARQQHWSEYTLYWLLALETGVAASYVQQGGALYQGIFTADDLPRLRDDWLQQNYDGASGPPFCVVQSTAGVGTARVARWVARYCTAPEARPTMEAVSSRLPDRLVEPLRRRHYRLRYAREVDIDLRPALVSFTFDDFPVSALEGARQLEQRGWRGTFYVNSGLLGRAWHDEQHCGADDVTQLAARGHEIGNHTHSHLRCAGQGAAVLQREYEQSQAALAAWNGNQSFAYPHGSFDLHALGQISVRFGTARTVERGVNVGRTDFNRLRASSISRDQSLQSPISMVDLAVSGGGWLIFYTHDVRPEPSRWGCTPERFAAILDYVQHAGLEVVTVAEGARRIRGLPR